MRRIIWLKRLIYICALCLTCSLSSAADVRGEMEKWHPIELNFNGPSANETDTSNNPFLDYRLSVTLTAPSGAITEIPGFFAGDGNGYGSGNIWRARFAADEIGQWQYLATLRQGSEVAVSLDDNAGVAVVLDGSEGVFDITHAASDAPLFLRHGRLEYVGEHYLKFRDGPYWIKGGTDSPENLLGFAGIDGTFDQGGIDGDFLHDFAAHRSDVNESDPYFTHATTGADSLGLIGALNYLGEKGVNSIYFLPMNLGGDGQETYPFVGAENTRFNKTHYDISKLYQWNVVLNHAQEKGIALNIVLSETETANELWLDNGELGVERRLFFRELVARFSYLLAIKWNLGEENDFPRVELDKHADYIQAIDWSQKPIAVHTHINQFYRYGEIVGDSRYSASSIQYDAEFAGDFVEQWRENSRNAGRPWVIDMDENTNGIGPDDISDRRKEILYDVLFSGGNIEWYFGYNPLPAGGDINAGDFRQRETMWDQMRFAREMMESQLPFWRMQPVDELLQGDDDTYGGAEVFAATGEIYAVYLPSSNGAEWLDLSGVDGVYQLTWFDPRTGSFSNVGEEHAGNAPLLLGAPPSSQGEDWVALVKRTDAVVTEELVNDSELLEQTGTPQFLNIPSLSLQAGEIFSVVLSAIDSDGTMPSVTARSLPEGMQMAGIGNGQLSLTWQVPLHAPTAVTIELIAIRASDASVRTSQVMTLNIVSNLPADTGTGSEHASIDSSGVTESPILRKIPNLSTSVGQTVVHRVEAEYATGVPPNLNVWDAPEGSEFTDNGDGSRTFYWTPTAADIGLRTLTFAAYDSIDPSAVDTVSVEILVTP